MNLGDTRTYLRDLLGEASPGFWSNATLNRFIQRSFLEVYTEFTSTNEAYFATTVDIAYVSGTQLYALPAAGIARVLLVERSDLSPIVTLNPIALVQKNDYQSQGGVTIQQGEERYYFLGNQMGFVPTPGAAGTARIYFVPEPTLPAVDADNYPAELTEMHHELIAWGGFIRAITKDRELLELHMPHYSRLWDLCRNDVARRQTQDNIGFIPRPE